MNDDPMTAATRYFALPADALMHGTEVVAAMAAYEGDDAFVFILYSNSSGYYVAEDSYCSCCSMPEWKTKKIEHSEVRQALAVAAEKVAGML